MDGRAVEDAIRTMFEEAGARGFLHAREVGGGTEVAVDADEPVVLASVFKIPVAVAFWRAVAAGYVDPREPATVNRRYRIGGVGTAGCADDVTMSLRDLVRLMMTLSDNAATDVVFHRLGAPAINEVLDDLALRRTRVLGCCEDLLAGMADELGFTLEGADLEAEVAAAGADRIWSLGVLDPERTTSSTPREVSALLEAIWEDRAAPAQACREVREVMAEQIWPHRLSSGFDGEVTVAAKTGTLPAIRNEAGVVTLPGGRAFAVSVFTRAGSLAGRLPAVDAAIGRAARLAVDHLAG
jgi:beta-lactamase class A